MSARFIIPLIIFLIIAGFLGLIGFQAYASFYGVSGQAPQGAYSFEVESGETLRDVADKLEKDNVVPNAEALILLERLNPVADLQVGTYNLELDNTKPEDVLTQIDSQTKLLQAAIIEAGNRPSTRVTLKEGYSLDQVMYTIAKNGVSTFPELKAYALDAKNFDRTVFPFLPELLSCTYGDFTKCAKYYPEGYIYPDTYDFFDDSTPEEVFNKMLGNFNRKVWLQLENKPSTAEFHKAIILASVLEKETGRTKGVTEATKATLSEERKIMADVFYNRIEQGMKWQSDVTLEYGHQEVTGTGTDIELVGRKVCQQTFTIPNCFLLDAPVAVNNKYSTYHNEGYPIGPVTSPQFDNINAALNPTANDYLFFLSDATGKKYFYETYGAFEAGIGQITQINRDLGLD